MTTSIMNTAQSGLQAAQAGLLVTSQNIAGSSVEGFSRRNATAIVSGLAPNSSVLAGTSFSVDGFTRYYSQLLETQRRAQQGKTSYFQTLVNSTEMLDALMADQSNSLALAVSEFFNAAGTLVSDPSSVAYRSNLTAKSGVVAQRLVSLADSLRVIQQDSVLSFSGTLQTASNVANRLAQVNVKILEGTSPGNFTPSADYLDERDRLLMQLQTLIGGQSVMNSDGTASHYIQGTPIVERSQASVISAVVSKDSVGDITVRFGTGISTALSITAFDGGEAGAFAKIVNDFLPELSRRLNDFAIDLVQKVNDISPNAIFAFANDGEIVTDPSTKPGVRASEFISVAPSDVSLYTITSAQATALEALRPDFADPIASLISYVGSQISSWVGESQGNTSLMNILNDRRESIAGVNLDEEAANMIKFQQLYAASSKLIQSGNQMFETLLAMMR